MHAKALMLLLVLWTAALPAEVAPLYEIRKEHDPDGIGKFYMGREIAHVMGHQGADWLERPQREEEERVDALVAALKLKAGEVVADIGAGTGYISRKLAKGVGPSGTVLAVEIQQEMLDILTNKAVAAGVLNIKPVLGTITDPKLGSETVDTVLMVDVYHEFDHPHEMMQAIRKSLKPGGRVVFVEYREEDPAVPIKKVHKMSEQQVKREAAAHDLTWKETIETLPRQHIIVFEKQGTQGALQRTDLPSLDEAVHAKRDVWGEAAMKEPNGPSYEFFEKLLPPPRYVNADFHYYPIVLSAPNAPVKARLISNGSGINVRPGSGQWNDNGTPFLFRVGPDQLLFGRFPERLQGEPILAEGYLPIVELRYMHQSPIGSEGMVPLNQARVDRDPEIYKLETFVSTDPLLASNGVAFARFSMTQGIAGTVTVQIESKSALKFNDGKVIDEKGQVLGYFDKNWKWERGRLQAKLNPKTIATIAIPTKPLAEGTEFKFGTNTYASQREQCAATWRKIVGQGMNVETPEPIVNNAWRHLLVQNFELINGDRFHYSHGNQYDKIYEAEGSDAALAMMVWGYEKDTRRLIVPLLDFTRQGLEFHQAGFKLNDICRYYWQTRDQNVIKELRAWSKPDRYRTSAKERISGWDVEAKRLDKNRTGPHGLFPQEQYCGDIHTPVQTLNANSKAWRALRDLSAVLHEVGETNEAEHYVEVAEDFRNTVLMAIEKSVDRSTTPPFVPIALYTNEPAHSPICDVRIGSYWNIIIGYTIASGIFPAGSEGENWIPHYQEQHGGLFMGMIRSGGMSNTWWNTEYKLNPLYGTRYALDTLRRDEPDRALVSFYGMLAHGFTRNTFICGEGAAIVPLDPYGRLLSLPPNSAANSHFLSMLRDILVQDSDANDDGQPETLRLAFATPQRWLEDGKSFKVERAPTAFGPVSLKMLSNLKDGVVTADVELPQRNQPAKILLRARVPSGWKVTSAQAGQTELKVDEKGTVDLTSLKGQQSIRFNVQR